MKYLIGIWVLAAICAGTVQAQDNDRGKRLAEIKDLEARAEKLLDEGRRPEAFDALARAAVLRDSLKKTGKPAPQAKPKVQKKPQPKAKKREKTSLERASDAFALALQSGDMQTIRKAAAGFRSIALATEAEQRKQLAAERRKRKQLERRLDDLEEQLMALKKLMQR